LNNIHKLFISYSSSIIEESPIDSEQKSLYKITHNIHLHPLHPLLHPLVLPRVYLFGVFLGFFLLYLIWFLDLGGVVPGVVLEVDPVFCSSFLSAFLFDIMRLANLESFFG
jgi:hypothetical protein